MKIPWMLVASVPLVLCSSPAWLQLALDYFSHKGVAHVAYVCCDNSTDLIRRVFASWLDHDGIISPSMKTTWVLVASEPLVLCSSPAWLQLALDYFSHKGVAYVAYICCYNSTVHVPNLVRAFNKHSMRLSVWRLSWSPQLDLERLLQQWAAPVGVIMEHCDEATLLLEASLADLFDDTHKWLVMLDEDDVDEHNTTNVIYNNFHHLNLSVDADICVVRSNGTSFQLYDVFNFGKIQGNYLEINGLGSWNTTHGLDIYLKGFKYDLRKDFHNLTFRAVTVILQGYESFTEEELAQPRFTPGVPFLTKIATMLLVMLKEPYNFQYNYTFIYRWIQLPEANTTPAVSNQLYWRKHDIALTGIRIFPAWLQWFDACTPALHTFETRIFYRIPSTGVGEYENRFLAPLSWGVWCAVLCTGALCVCALCTAAAAERRARPAQYATFSVAAAACQQDFEDGETVDHNSSSQAGRLTLLVVGLTSMLLYNYYTSSVVSWLLSAAAPTIHSLDALIQSNLELVFEDTGYGRQWVYNPGPFYLSGYKNIKEDELREKKIRHTKRTVEPVMSAVDGINLVRRGGYAFHAELYTANLQISRTFDERELCELGYLQMISGKIFAIIQKRSPYKQFFSWSLQRLTESGHIRAARARTDNALVACPGTVPRALTLGQAAPAFLLLAIAAALAALIALAETLHYRFHQRRGRPTKQRRCS